MLSTDEVFSQVVADGTRRLRRRRRRTAWLAGPTVVTLIAGAFVLRTPDRLARTTVSVAAPAPTTVAPTTTLPGGFTLAGPLPNLPAEAPVWTDIPPDLPFVQRLADALGVGGTATATADGFTVVGGRTSLSVTPSNGVRTWLIRMDNCPPGQCRPPDVRPTVPAPTVETRDTPDHPPFEAAPVAAEAARRIATFLGGVSVTHLQMSLAEWWAPMQFLAGGQPMAQSGFTAYIEPDGSVRYAMGAVDRPGQPSSPRELVGMDEALRRLAVPPEVNFGVLVVCHPGPCPPPKITGVRLSYRWAGDGNGFVPVYVFSIEGGETSERWVDAL